MNRVWLQLFLLIVSTASFAVKAEFTSDKCVDGSSQSTSDFGVVAQIGGNLPRESIVASKPHGQNLSEVLWSNDSDITAFIQDTLTNDVPERSPEQLYKIWLTYEANSPSGGNNKTGQLSYYLEVDGTWQKKSQVFASLKGLNDTHLVIEGEQNVEVKCDDNLLPPPITQPPTDINRSPRFEFGTVDINNCGENRDGIFECSIPFTQNYKNTPFVFVMPTINASLSSGKTTEYPSTVSVISVSDNSATIVQEFSPYNSDNKGSKSFDPSYSFLEQDNTQLRAEMAKVDYFVMEPGVLELSNGAKIVAGSVNTDTAASEGNRNENYPIEFSNFGLDSGFGNNNIPGVLVQPQTKNKAPSSVNWFTGMARSVTSSGFKLALDKSEVYKLEGKKNNKRETLNPLVAQEVAFVAGLGSGYINGLRFWLGEGVTRRTTGLKEKIVSPIVEACKLPVDISGAGFENGTPILVANKNSRSGPNGGWVKRCDINEKEAFFVVEEDMSKDQERGHAEEKVGFFMFEQPKVEECRVFNSPVQTWVERDNSGAVIGGNGGIYFANGAEVIGADWLEVNGVNSRVIGFDDAKVKGHIEVGDDYDWDDNLACEGAQCFGSSGLRAPKEALETYIDMSDAPAKVEVNAGEMRSDFVDGEKIKSLHVGGVVTLTSGTYWFEKIDIWGSGRIEIPEGEKVTINTKQLQVSNSGFIGVDVLDKVSSRVAFTGMLRVNVYDFSSNGFGNLVDFNSSGDAIAVIYSEVKVNISNGFTLYGALTALDVHMSNDATIQAASSCLEPVDNYELTLSPQSQLSLMCGTEYLPTFTINTANNGQGKSLKVDVTLDATKFNILATTGSGSYPTFTSDSSGLLELQVSVKSGQEGNVALESDYELTAKLNADSSASETAKFRFTPFMFSANDVNNYIAGDEINLDAKVVGCSGGSAVTVKSYNSASSKPVIDLSLPKQSGNSDNSLISYTPLFSNGEAKGTTLQINESGEFLVTLTDDTFKCSPSDADGCPINDETGSADPVKLSGSFTVKSRPYKIAICDVHEVANISNINPATTGSGTGFMASSEMFSVTYKPIRLVASANECDNASITTNYAEDSGPFSVSKSLNYPLNGDEGEITSVGESTNFASGSSVLTASYSWDEVGSLEFVTPDTVTYLGMTLNSDSQIIGRFYPALFQVTGAPSWDYLRGDFAFMNQPFESVDFQVEALNSDDERVENYDHTKGYALTADFSLFEDNAANASRLNVPTFSAAWVDGVGTFSWNNATGNTQCSSAFCWRKASTTLGYEDGPFNSSNPTNISITDEGITNPDPVVINDSAKALTPQPNIRFGRVSLDSAGGQTLSDISIPLQIEFWNGSRFEVDTADSTTNISGIESESDINIWTEEGMTAANVSLSGGGVVSSGTSRSINAAQSAAVRQQTQVWLDISALPWLRYNWDDDNATDDANGEQDPSTVVTFGIYRGNDRVIFRGEPGLTGQ